MPLVPEFGRRECVCVYVRVYVRDNPAPSINGWKGTAWEDWPPVSR